MRLDASLAVKMTQAGGCLAHRATRGVDEVGDAAFDRQVGNGDPPAHFIFIAHLAAGRTGLNAEDTVGVMHRDADGVVIVECTGDKFDTGVTQGHRFG